MRYSSSASAPPSRVLLSPITRPWPGPLLAPRRGSPPQFVPGGKLCGPGALPPSWPLWQAPAAGARRRAQVCCRLPGERRPGAAGRRRARRVARGLEGPGRARVTARAVGVAPRLAAVRRARPARASHSACECAVPIAAPCAPSFGLCFEPFHRLRVRGPGHTSPRPGPWRLAPAESGRRAGGAFGAAGVSAGSPGARLCARAGRGRAVTRRAQRIPDSRPALRPPRTSAHCLPGSGRRRRTVSIRVRSSAALAPCPYSFFRLVLIWGSCSCCFYYST